MSQIETVMLVALGFVAALLIGLLLLRILWSYAVALGKRRVERRAPSAIAELQADRDRLKAEYAMQGRRLQLRLDDLKTRMAEQLAEASRNRNRIEQLAGEIRLRDETIEEREKEIAKIKAQSDDLERELAERTELVQQTKDLLLTREEEASELKGKLTIIENQLTEQAQIASSNAKVAATGSVSARASGAVVGTDNSKSSSFEDAHDRLRQRIAELNSLTKQIDDQRRDLTVQQKELHVLRNQISRAQKSDQNAKEALDALNDDEATDKKSTAASSKVDTVVEDITSTSDDIERQLREAEEETQNLSSELSRLDELWNASTSELGIDEKEQDSKGIKLSVVASNEKDEKKQTKGTAKKSKATRKGAVKASAAKSKTAAARKRAASKKTATKKTESKSASKTTTAKTRKQTAKSKASTSKAAAAKKSNSKSDDSLEKSSKEKSSNVISLAQRIRALQTEL